MFCFLLVLSQVCTLSYGGVVRHPEADRFMAFEDLRVGEKLVGFTLARYKTTSRLKCAIYCAFTPRCQSYNFHETRTCELNHGDAFTGTFSFYRFCGFFQKFF